MKALGILRTIAGGLFLASACGRIGGEGDSETHWMLRCQSDEECGADGSCLCGVCTVPCDADNPCSAGRTEAVASRAPELRGAGATPPPKTSA
jgi:hypothetical protein